MANDLSTFLSADCLPGLLSGWAGRVTALDGPGLEFYLIGFAPDRRARIVRVPSDGYFAYDGEKNYMEGWLESYQHLILVDTSRPEVRDQVARVIARILGVPVGATAPVFGEWWRIGYRDKLHFDLGRGPSSVEFWAADPGDCDGMLSGQYLVPSLALIPLDSPNRDALALAAVARWLGEEIPL
jgi:hypothetical protein